MALDSPSVNALLATLPIYVIILLGWLTRRAGWITPENDSALMRLSMDLALPCFILVNMMGNPALKSVGVSLTAIGLGAAGVIVCLLISWFISSLAGFKTGEGKRTFVVTAGIHNYGFFVISFVALLHNAPGDPMLGLVLTHNVGCDLILWSVGLLLISGRSALSYRLFLRGPVIVVFIGLFLIWTGWDQFVPGIILDSLRMIGNCAIPLNLIIFGNMVYDLLGHSKFSPKMVAVGTATRVLILPLVFIGMAVMLPLDMDLKKLMVFQSLAPCGVTSALIAKHFGGHPGVAVQITVATCAASLVTLPFWYKIGFSWIGAMPW